MDNTDRFHMEIRALGRGFVVDLAGDLSSPFSDRLLQKLKDFQAEEKYDLILNFRDVEYISDEAIGQLKWALEQSHAKGGDLKIINIKPIIKHRFDALGVSEEFNIHLPVPIWNRERIADVLRRVGIYFSKRTGLRVSTFVLILFLVAIIGWHLSLRSIIKLQSKQMGELNTDVSKMEQQIFVLRSERSRYMRQIKQMKEKLTPLEAIGFFTLSLDDEELDSGSVVMLTFPTTLDEDLLPGGQTLDSLSAGDSVIVLSHQGIRIKVKTPDGREGWITQDAVVDTSKELP